MNAFSKLDGRQKVSVLIILMAAVALWAVDAIDDLSHGSSWGHLAIEGIIISFAAFWIITVAVRYFVSKKENVEIRADLANVRKSLEDYRKETQHLVKGLSLKIDEQLEKWEMTKAEKEIALLLLKGFANKEIADIRGTSEKTVTQQITAVYTKSGLRNRSEFAAFFLEDLLLPDNQNA
ncbi:MAG: helix-turn-helix transcriptional regulator [Bdellovibrionota bacterium]